MSESELHIKIRHVVKKLVQSPMGKQSDAKYSAASATLHSIIASPSNLEDIQRNWRRILGEFHWSNSMKTNETLREQLLNYIVKIGQLVAEEDFGSFVKHLHIVCTKSKREDERCLYLQAIAALVEKSSNDVRPLSVENITIIMDITKAYLDDNDSPVELVPLLDICSAVSQFYPNEFASYLHDICDFVIGWYMDRNQPDFVETKCHEMVCMFKPYFYANVDEAIGFLMSLIDDLLFTVQQLTKENDEKSHYFVFSNIVSILIVFDDICQNSFTQENIINAQELAKKLFNNLDNVMAATDKCGGKLAGVTFLHLANVLLRVAEFRASDDCVEIREHVSRLLDKAYACPVTSKRDILSTIQISEKIMANDQNVDKASIVKLIMSFCTSDNCLKHMSADLCADVSTLFTKTLNTSDLSSILPIYQHLADKLQAEFKHLKNCLDGDLLSRIARKREHALMALLSSLDSLVVAKNSIIVLRGLNPSLFALLFVILPLQEKWLITYFPNTFLCLLTLAKKFAKTHSQFVANSDLLVSSHTKTSFYIESPAAKNFELILGTLSTLLEQGVGTLDEIGEDSLIDWLDALSQAISVEMARTLDRNANILKLQRAMLNVFMEQRLAKKSNNYKTLLTAIHRFGAFNALADREFCIEFSTKLYQKADVIEQEQFFKLVSHLPANYLLSDTFAECVDKAHFYKQEMLGRPLMGTFYFQLLTNFLVDGVAPFQNKDRKLCPEVLNRLYIDLVEDRYKSVVVSSNRQLALVAQQYVLFCVENRLKTPIGKAVDTFTKFDGAIAQLVSEVNWLAEYGSIKNLESETPALNFPHNIKRVIFALDIIDAFDKLMNFANHGSIFNLAVISMGSRHFFHNNEASWQSWLSRIALPTMSLCFATGRYAQIVRLGGNLFNEAEKRYFAANKILKLDSITLAVICWLVRAYVELAAPLAIRGVRRWVQRIFQMEMSWITFAEHLASFNYESALTGFCDILTKERLHNYVMDAIRAMCVKAIQVFRHSAFTKPFHELILKSIRASSGSLEESKKSDYLKSQLESTLMLSSWTELQASSIQSAFNTAGCYDLSALVNQTEVSLACALSTPTEAFRLKVDSRYAFEEEFPSLYSLTLTENRDDSVLLNAKATILKQALSILKTTNKRAQIGGNAKNDNFAVQRASSAEKSIINSYANMYNSWNIVAKSANMEVGQMFCSWVHHLYMAGKMSASRGVEASNGYYHGSSQAHLTLRPVLIAAHAEMAHVAAKTGNPSLSQFHLRKYSDIITATGDVSISISGFGATRGGFTRSIRQDSPSFIFANGGKTLHERTVTPSLDTNGNLKTFLRTAKITWNLESETENSSVRADCFRNMLDVICAHSSTDTASDPTQTIRRMLLSKIAGCLGKWSEKLPNSLNILFQMHSSAPHFMLQKILQFREQLENDCAGIDSVLRGAFLMTASNTVTLAGTDIHYALANWSLEQLYYDAVDDSFVNGEATRVLRVSANDSALFRKMGISLDFDDGQKFLSLMGRCKTLTTFKQSVKQALNLDDTSILISALSLTDFIQLWTVIKLRQFKLFEIALNSSINFLTNVDASDQKSKVKIISTCLRVLEFLSSQSEWFKQIVGLNWLTNIEVIVWKDVISQIFACMSHAESFVRQTAQQILVHVGEALPYVVCFPAIVNSTSKLFSSTLNTEGGNVDNKSFDEETSKLTNDIIMTNLCANRRNSFSQKQLRLQESCGRLVESLRRHSPEMVDDVIRFCNEMQKVNVLREERWLFALTRLENALMKRVAEVEAEFRGQFSYDHLTDEQKAAGVRQRHEAISTPTYERLKHLFESTCTKEAETENDMKFRDVFKVHLQQAMEHFYENRGNLHAAIEPFRNIMSMITARAMKRSALSLQIADISPYLAEISASNVPIPGQQFSTTKLNRKNIITIQKVHSDVLILPTKTRPKKITFTGSDGKTHPFLFKGHEDLRLDERVMQLSRVCNTLLRSKIHKLLPFHHTSLVEEFMSSTYSVTPLGHESGLIEWVDGATPLFHLYQKWKIREAEDQDTRRQQMELKGQTALPDSPSAVRKGPVAQRNDRGRKSPIDGPRQNDTSGTKTRDLARPTEQFFAKLKAVLTEEGVALDVLKNRQRWPVSCLKKVYEALVKETPQDILSKELWMHAGNSSTWWHVTRHFARSVAVASIVGWTVLGLGDRHLDNVLVDLKTGRVVHVDYNVSFEKGRTLRVPETVPFRLTGNIVCALGPTGVEGMFRESAIHVLTQLRANKEVLLSLLELSGGCGPVDTKDKTVVDESTLHELHKSNDTQFDAISSSPCSVTRSVRFKLNGCETIERISRDGTISTLIEDGQTSSMSPEKQVDFLIEKATDPVNLALLFEGWTAWV